MFCVEIVYLCKKCTAMDSTKNDQYNVWMGHHTVMEHAVETNRGGGGGYTL